MRALKIELEKYLNFRQKLNSNSESSSNPLDVIELDKDFHEPNLINDDWIKIRVRLGGICGTDLSFIGFKSSFVLSNFCSFPLVPGHEVVGVVEEIGGNVDNFSIGDRVILDENLGCKVRDLELCPSCKKGNYNLCENYDKGIIAPGAITGFCRDTGGGWGESVIAHKFQVFKIPDNLSYEEALIAEPLACAIHAVSKELPLNDENCVVVGCGTIGLCAIAALKALGRCNLIALAKYPFQQELAEKLGADEVFLIKKNHHLKKIGKELGSRIVNPPMELPYLVGGGADIVIDSVGNESSLTNSFRFVKSSGTVILLGYPSYINIDWTPLMAKEVNVKTSNIFSYTHIKGKKRRTLEIALELLASRAIDARDFITHKFSIENYKEALVTAFNKSKNNAIKVAFKFP
ncbi:MAG: zinc-dependent alcohol dehydrogenase [Promethearchaeota archaeon]